MSAAIEKDTGTAEASGKFQPQQGDGNENEMETAGETTALDVNIVYTASGLKTSDGANKEEDIGEITRVVTDVDEDDEGKREKGMDDSLPFDEGPEGEKTAKAEATAKDDSKGADDDDEMVSIEFEVSPEFENGNDDTVNDGEEDEEAEDDVEEEEDDDDVGPVGASYQKITNIEDRLLLEVAKVKQGAQSRAPEIVPLSKQYNVFRKKLRLLVAAAKKYHETTMKQDKARAELINHLAVLSANSPMYDNVGKTEGVGIEVGGPGEEATEVQENPFSLAYMQNEASKNVKLDGDDYNEKVLGYAAEWEKIVTKRIDYDIKDVKKLQRNRNHYETKVAKLRQNVNRIESKGKDVPQATVEKLDRNEKKLKDAVKAHEFRSAQLCVMIEEATVCGWKDLYPLVVNILQWDETRRVREKDAYKMIPTTLESIAAVTAAANAEKVGTEEE